MLVASPIPEPQSLIKVVTYHYVLTRSVEYDSKACLSGRILNFSSYE